MTLPSLCALTGSGLASPRRDTCAGVTLIEMLVALVLFALIGGAGYSVLDQLISVQDKTAGRLERLVDVQRTMQIITQDFMFAAPHSLAGAGASVSLRRTTGDGVVAVRYQLQGSVLVRQVLDAAGVLQAQQRLVGNVGASAWNFFEPAAGWVGSWPPPQPTEDTAPREPLNPAAVSVEILLEGPAPRGLVRRVAVLPTDIPAQEAEPDE